MNSILTYLIQLNIAVTLFFLVYLIIFRKDGNFNNRRAFLLFAMGISFLVPFIKINLQQYPVQGISSAMISLEEIIVQGGNKINQVSSFSILSTLSIIYLSISTFFLGRLFIGLYNIVVAGIKSDTTIIEGTKIKINSKMHASSFFNIIFIDPSIVKDNDLSIILKHEKLHVKLIHSIDRLLSEILISISWINPVMWILRKSVVVNHEYQADNRIVELGTDQNRYQMTILNQYIGSASISNQFSNQIKSRINMLNKNYKKGSFWKSMILFPISLALLLIISCNKEGTNAEIIGDNPDGEELIYYQVEEMPQWPDSEDMVLSVRKFVATNIAYPKEAKEKGAEGKVYIHFLVTKTGDVVVPDPSQLPPEQAEDGAEKEVVVAAYRSLNNDDQDLPEDEIIQLFKDESVRVIELMPDLIPGKQNGEAVNVIYTMPITFKLK